MDTDSRMFKSFLAAIIFYSLFFFLIIIVICYEYYCYRKRRSIPNNIIIKNYKKEIKDRICLICREEDSENMGVKIYYHLDKYKKIQDFFHKNRKDSDCFLTYHEECFDKQIEYQKQKCMRKEIECSCKRSKLTHRTP